MTCFINETVDTSCCYACLFTASDFTKTETNRFHFCFDKLQLVSQCVNTSQRKRVTVNSHQTTGGKTNLLGTVFQEFLLLKKKNKPQTSKPNAGSQNFFRGSEQVSA